MKKLLFLILLGLVSCTSAPKKENLNYSEQKPNSSTQESAKISGSQGENATKEQALLTALNDRNLDSIKKASEAILLDNPNHELALNGASIVYILNKQPEAAQVLLKKSVTQHPKSTSTLVNLGIAQSGGEAKADAISSFERALEVNPASTAAKCNLSSVYIEAREVKKLNELFGDSFDYKKVSSTCSMNYAIALTANNKLSEAEQVYEFILSKEVNHQNALVNYSVLMIDKVKNFQKGLNLIQKINMANLSDESAQLIKNLESKAKTAL